MRYAKDSIRLSESQDYPLLKQVLRSEFATQGQLFQFMSLGQREWSRRSFDWRLRRLADHLLVERSDRFPSLRGETVYRIAPTGAAVLEGLGEYCLFAPDRSNNRSDGRREQLIVLHSLELNEIHLSLLRKNPAAGWTYATEIRSQNELTRFGYAKDYDAVMTLHLAEQEVRIALEYERTPKAHKALSGDRKRPGPRDACPALAVSAAELRPAELCVRVLHQGEAAGLLWTGTGLARTTAGDAGDRSLIPSLCDSLRSAGRAGAR